MAELLEDGRATGRWQSYWKMAELLEDGTDFLSVKEAFSFERKL